MSSSCLTSCHDSFSHSSFVGYQRATAVELLARCHFHGSWEHSRGRFFVFCGRLFWSLKGFRLLGRILFCCLKSANASWTNADTVWCSCWWRSSWNDCSGDADARCISIISDLVSVSTGAAWCVGSVVCQSTWRASSRGRNFGTVLTTRVCAARRWLASGSLCNLLGTISAAERSPARHTTKSVLYLIWNDFNRLFWEWLRRDWLWSRHPREMNLGLFGVLVFYVRRQVLKLICCSQTLTRLTSTGCWYLAHVANCFSLLHFLLTATDGNGNSCFYSLSFLYFASWLAC